MAGMVGWKESSFPGLGSLLTLVAITGQRNSLYFVPFPPEPFPARLLWIPICTVLCSARGFLFPWGRSRLLLRHYLAWRISQETNQDFPPRTHPLPAPTVAGWIITWFRWRTGVSRLTCCTLVSSATSRITYGCRRELCGTSEVRSRE